MNNGAGTPQQQVTEWLSGFGAALARGDIASAVALFDADCYWRDLVSFTWNLKTLEGKAEITAMLEATLSETRPTCWQIEGEPVAEGAAIRSNFTFETAVGRGRGIL